MLSFSTISQNSALANATNKAFITTVKLLLLSGICSIANPIRAQDSLVTDAKNHQDWADKKYILRPGEKMEEKVSKNLFVRFIVSKNTCYIQEPVEITYKLYSRLDCESEVVGQPVLEGFTVYDKAEAIPTGPTVEMVEGQAFNVRTLYAARVIPLNEGDLTFGPIKVKNYVRFIKQPLQNNTGNSLDALMDQLAEEEKATKITYTCVIQNTPAKIRVLPLPKDQPTAFTGAVGDFSIRAFIDSGATGSTRASSVKLEIKGKGNWPFIDEPVVQWPQGVDNYDVQSTIITDKTDELSGIKTFSYALTCNAGEYTIPPIPFSYFDLATLSYKTIYTTSLQLRMRGSVAKRSDEIADKKLSPVTVAALPALQHIWKYVMGAIVLAVGLLTFFAMRKRWMPRSVLRKSASTAEVQPVVWGPLAPAKELLSRGDRVGFYQTVAALLWHEVSVNYGVPYSELNKKNISLQLQKHQWDLHTIDQLLFLIAECETNLYIPGHTMDVHPEFLNKVEKMIYLLKQGSHTALQV